MRLAMALVFVREKHHTELPYDRIEAGIRERQGRRIGGPELDYLVCAKFSARDFKHWRIEIGGGQMRFSRQHIAKAAGYDPSARRDF
jgi:hypothetical protein